jgi:hypothetical protein
MLVRQLREGVPAVGANRGWSERLDAPAFIVVCNNTNVSNSVLAAAARLQRA